MQNSTLIKGYRAATDLEAHQIVKLNNDGQVVSAASKSDYTIGVTGELSAKENITADIILSGIAEVTLAGTVAIGHSLTATTGGKAIQSSSPCRVIAIALKSGVSGDRIPALLSQSQIA